MSHIYTGPNASARDAIAAILDKANQLPQPGRHVGPRASEGPPIAANWDGDGRVPLGWTSFQAHRNGDDEIWLPEPETATKLARLTAGEQAQLAAARAAAEPHGAESSAKESR